jgi:hypothetical protein
MIVRLMGALFTPKAPEQPRFYKGQHRARLGVREATTHGNGAGKPTGA